MRYLAVLCLWLGIHTYAYPQEYTVREYTMEQGLPADIVYEITQDDDGYIWIATTNGLCRYDGFVFKEYANQHIFTEDMPWLFNYDGEIYTLTWSGKLGHIKNDSLQSFSKMDIQSGIRYFMRDRYGGYWIKVAGREILHIYQGKIEHLSSLDSRIYEDKDGTVYTYSHGLSYYDVKKRKLITIREWLYDTYTISGGVLIFHDDRYRCTVYKNISFREECMSIDLQKDENGRALQVQHLLKKNANEYWFQDYKNIVVYDSLGTLRENITEGIHKSNLKINTFFIDREDNVWIGTQGQGLLLLKKKPVKNTFPVKDRYISQLAGNTQGDIMVTHQEGKISLLDHRGGYHTYTIPGSTASIFYGVHTSQENFLGVFDRYLFFSDDQQRIHVSPTLTPIKDIGKEKTDRYMTGYLNEEAWGYSFLKRNNGDLWVGTNMGIYVVPANGIPHFVYTSVKEFRKFGITTQKKGCTMDSRFEEIKAYKMDMKGTGENTATFIRQLLEDDRGVIWIATQCEGVFAYYKDVFYHFTKNDGLLSNNINSIYIDSKNRLWVCSNVGVTYITPEGSIQHITTEDGIRSNQVNGVFVSDRDEVYLGTAKGLSMVDLNRKIPFTPYPPILLKVKVNDSIYSLHDADTSLVLSHRENNIQVDYISVSFNSPLRYMYFIEGLMHKWETTDSRSIYLPRMQPGDYRLKIKSVRQGGEESREVTLLKFTITAPFWKYNIFWVVVLVTVSILVYLAGYYRRKRAMAQLRLRQRISDLEKKALLSQINPHFVFNCLAAIKYLLTNGELDKTEEYIQKFATLMRNTLDFSENKLIPLQEEATYIENYLALEGLRFGQAYEYEIKIEENIDMEQVFLPPMLLQPYIENAIRHGLRPKKETGWLSIHFYMEKEYLYVKIDDNGIGRKEAARLKEKNTIHYQSKGMDISKQRAFLQDIKVNIVDKKTEDGQPAGTRIILKIPQI